MQNNKKIIHILMSEYVVDSRVRNETGSLKSCFDVEVFCLKDETGINGECRDGVQLRRFGIRNTNKIIRMMVSYIGMFIYALRKDISVVHSHDLNALPVAFFIAKTKRVPLIYDSHELWSESIHENYPHFLLNFVKRVEIMLAHRASHIITVSQSIANHLELLFNNSDISVVRNVPSYTHEGDFDIFRKKYLISNSVPIFIYQGLISKHRGVNMIVDALKLMDKKLEYYFIFLGDGDFKNELRALVLDNGLSDHVLIENAVSQDVLLKYTSSADIGIHALDNSCLNHEYCLPNKIFEYLNAGLGVICPDLVELKKFIDSENIGTTYSTGSSSLLCAELERYVKNPELIQQAKNAANISKKHLNWHNEEKVLFDAYEKVI